MAAPPTPSDLDHQVATWTQKLLDTITSQDDTPLRERLEHEVRALIQEEREQMLLLVAETLEALPGTASK